MLKSPAIVLVCAVAFGAVDGAAQVRSGAAAVTLVATVRESFTVLPTEFQLAEQQKDEIPATRGVYAFLGWQLRQARNFRLQWEVEKFGASPAPAWHSGLLTLRQLAAQSARMSFVANPSSEPLLLAPGQNAEDAPVGSSGVFLIFPTQPEGEEAVLRIRVVIL